VKKWLIFLGKFLLISIVLFASVAWVGRCYQAVLGFLAAPFLPASRHIVLEYTSYLRIIPFLALMLATPGIAAVRRIPIILAGVALFLAIDLAAILAWGGFPTRQSSAAHVVFTLVWQTVGQWILPFLLWLIAVNKSSLGQCGLDKKRKV
jgi:hypothetical protein